MSIETTQSTQKTNGTKVIKKRARAESVEDLHTVAVKLSKDEHVELTRRAELECRSAAMQARYILRAQLIVGE